MRVRTFRFKVVLVIVLLVYAARVAYAAEAKEVIDATAYGISTQLERNVNIKLLIYGYSAPQDRKVLNDAFRKGQNQGLVNALAKMKSVGLFRFREPLALRYRTLPRFPRPPTATSASLPTAKSVSAKPTAIPCRRPTISPAAKSTSMIRTRTRAAASYTQLVISADGDLQIELRKNPWRLSNIIMRGKEAE